MSLFLQYHAAQALGDLGAGSGAAAAGFGLAAGLGYGLLAPRLWSVAWGLGAPRPQAQRPPVRFCGHCGAPLVTHARFCGRCGAAAWR